MDAESETRPRGLGGEFERDAVTVLARLQKALADVVAALPQAVTRPADLRHALRVGRRPAWELFRFITAASALAEAHNVPGPVPLNRFLREAAAEPKMSRGRIDTAREAHRAYLRLIRTHPGNRQSFDSMIGALLGRSSAQVDLVHKRGAFRHNSHIVGAQARSQFQCTFHKVCGETLDILLLQGFADLRRFRSFTVPLLSHTTYGKTSHTDRPGTIRREPLVDPDELVEGVSILREFCSRPLPHVATESFPSGARRTVLEMEGLGNRSSVTYAIADLTRNCPLPSEEPMITSHAAVGIPTEVLVHDVLVCHDELPVTSYDAVVYWKPGPFRDPELPLVHTSNTLAIKENTVHMGRGTAVVTAPEVPRYRDMVISCCERMGWDPDAFDVYRCRVEYPVLHTRVMVWCGLGDSAPRY